MQGAQERLHTLQPSKGSPEPQTNMAGLTPSPCIPFGQADPVENRNCASSPRCPCETCSLPCAAPGCLQGIQALLVCFPPGSSSAAPRQDAGCWAASTRQHQPQAWAGGAGGGSVGREGKCAEPGEAPCSLLPAEDAEQTRISQPRGETRESWLVLG